MDEYKPNPPASGRWKPGQSGNPAGRPKIRPYKEALDRVLKAIGESAGRDAAHAMDQIAAAHVTKCMSGDMAAIKELAERHDGKVPQAVVGGDEDDNPIKIETIRRIIVRPGHPDSGSVPAATVPSTV